MAAAGGDRAGVTAALRDLDLTCPSGITDALARAFDTFDALIDDALGDPDAVCGPVADD